MDLNAHYRAWLHVRRPDCALCSDPSEIAEGADCAMIRRDKASFRGLGTRASLRELQAANADQAMLEEIAGLEGLEYLDLAWPMVATDLAPLRKLTKLRDLRIDSPRNIADFTPVLDLPALERLFIENAKHLAGLDWLRPLKDRLVALGIEGSLYTAQRIPSLAPLEGFGLEALFLTNTRLDDQDLAPIATMPNLRYLGTALNAPKARFLALKAARPGLECSWFDEALLAGFRDPRPPKR